MNIIENVTLLIPTRNRDVFLNRAVEFYKKTGGYPKIIVADSSDEQIALKNKMMIETYKSELDVSYFLYQPKISVWHKISEAIKHVGTIYLSIVADDDYIFPDFISLSAISIKNNNYSAIISRRARITMCSGKFDLSSITIKQFKEIVSEDPVERIRQHIEIKNSSPFYGLFPKEHLKKAFKYIEKYTVTNNAEKHDVLAEVLFNLIIVSLGKIGLSEDIGWLYVKHENNFAITGKSEPYEKVIAENISYLERIFVGFLRKEFRITKREEKEVRKILNSYCNKFRLRDKSAIKIKKEIITGNKALIKKIFVSLYRVYLKVHDKYSNVLVVSGDNWRLNRKSGRKNSTFRKHLEVIIDISKAIT